MAAMVKIKLNGLDHSFEGGLSLELLLAQIRLNSKVVVVEHNQLVVSKEKLSHTIIQEGDQVEVVQFVGGGAPDAQPVPVKKSRKKKAGPTKLVIVESPAKAKTINKFLGDDYLVEASFGHVRDLPKSKMGIDVEHDFAPHYIVMMKARARVKNLKKIAKDMESIYLAPDPDREGEAISWHLAHIFREEYADTISIQRVVFNEITKDAIQEAFRHPREIAINLVNAQQARRILDRMVGYELSPLLWRKVARGLSAGRVQSVALRLIVDREREIRSFVPLEYWSLKAKLSSQKQEQQNKIFLAKFDRVAGEKIDLKNAEETHKFKAAIKDLPFKVDKIDRRERIRRPQAPFTTSKIQQEAYNRLGFPAAKTMRVAQKLYEGVELGAEGSVGLITYMRTDSVHLAASAQKEMVDYIRKQFGDSYLPEKPPIYKSKKGAQEAHEAIRPTGVQREPSAIKSFLDDDEFKLYELIWKKALASQMANALDETISISIVAGDKYFFKASGRKNIFPGFGVLYEDIPVADSKKKEGKEEEDEEPQAIELPALTEGEILKLHELLDEQHFTKPPGRYNDASLVKILEEEGIGRPSTYAPTIYTLLYRTYVNRRGGALEPSELGEMVVDLLVEHFPKILDVQFTAGMEAELDKIEDGEADWVKVIKDFYGPFMETVTVARELIKTVRPADRPTEYKCEKCEKNMVIKWGRFGEFMACSGFPECRNTKSMPTGVKCPEPDCGGDLVKRMSKKRRTFYGCSNYPKCSHITNKLIKKDSENVAVNGESKASDNEAVGGDDL
ncbi:MAG: type I DNA topoisomerase [Candidatus Omnitrophica bacterium]|nr:type I DNA topoisomerase [Candidatus Omnitrophota bacterium]